MSETMILFIGTEEKPDVFAEERAKTLGIELRPTESSDTIAYGYRREQKWKLRLSLHESPTTQDLWGISSYRYEMNIDIWGVEWQIYPEARVKLARVLFEKLKVTGKYRLLLVQNLEEFLERFDPE